MRVKLRYIAALSLAAGLCSQPASAISEAYREQLENSGCTQVSEANGTCNVQAGEAPSHRYGDEGPRRDRYSDDDQPSPADIADHLDSHIDGTYQGQATDYMQAHGWEPVNEEHTHWSKNGYVAKFIMNDSDRILRVIVQ